MHISTQERILFIGDSITDAGRDRHHPAAHFGHGYVSLIAAQIEAELASPDVQIWNRGISGNRIGDLLGRIEADVLALQPTLISVLVGINDRFDPIEDFRQNYRTFLGQIREKLSTQIILLEPFLLPVSPEQIQWRDIFAPKTYVVRDLALEFGTELLPLEGIFAEATTRAPAEFWASDGIHPTRAGHALIAEEWLDRVEVE